VEGELIEILRDADARALIFHSRFAKRVEKIAPMLPRLTVLLQVEDGSGAPLVSGAREYEEAIASASADRPDLEWSPDDLYMTYTGGTTGLPKGVLWRQADIIVANMNGRREDGCLIEDMTEIVERAESSKIRVLPQAPFMHVAGHAAALGMWECRWHGRTARRGRAFRPRVDPGRDGARAGQPDGSGRGCDGTTDGDRTACAFG